MNALTEFLQMGGYAVYVWPSYGVAVAALIANVIMPAQCERRAIRQLKARRQRVQRSRQEVTS